MTRAAYIEMMGGKTRRADEEALQRAIVEHLTIRGRKDIWWWHCPSGGKRSKASAGKLKAMGVKPGIPDLQFLFPDGHVAFMEIKIPGGAVSPEQMKFIEFCDRAGVEGTVVYNIDQALDVLEAWEVIR